MNRRDQFGTALIVLALVLFTVPALFPVQPQFVHDTGVSTGIAPGEFEDHGYEVVAYENLSDRGQALYREALESRDEHRVPLGEGAPEFDYPTREELAGDDETARPAVVIERPAESSDLPRADERYYGRHEDNEDLNETEARRQAMRYDMMGTTTEQPPLGSPPQLIRLLAVVLAVVSLGTGGYLLSSK